LVNGVTMAVRRVPRAGMCAEESAMEKTLPCPPLVRTMPRA
jgi:hypothetical protein